MDKNTSTKVNGEWKKTVTRKYIICSIEDIEAKQVLEIKRSYWAIEMQHWILDVKYNEDRLTARKDNAIQNSSAFKRFAMRIKKGHKQFKKLSLNRFFMYTNNNLENLIKILFSNNSE